MDPPEVLKLLESNHPETVEEAKKKFHEHFNGTKESWLLNGLVDYFISTGSMRCVDILVGVREPHDKYFFDRVFDSLKNAPAVRLSVLTLLGHVVFRQPTWLYKISQHSLLKEVLRILKTETDILILISALLTLIVLLPTIPANIGPFLQEIFEVFSRLASWNTNNPNKLPEPQIIHLQVSLQSLFHRLYGMYPCNFLSYLRNEYSLRENLGVFSHTIKPMLDTVKMHPLLVTASKDTETTTNRWKTMEHHDVVVECAKLSVFAKEEINMPCFSTNKQKEDSELKRFIESANQDNLVVQNTVDFKEFWSPSIHCGASTPPLSTRDSSVPASIPHTPITQVQNYAISSFPSQEGTSPPEAAIEATPETTPVKDMRLYAPRGPPIASVVARPLNLTGSRPRSSTSSTPSQSQPSSPMKKEISPFRFPEGHDCCHESSFAERRKESIITQKVSSMLQDNLNLAATAIANPSSSNGEKISAFIRSPGKLNTGESTCQTVKEANIGTQGDECTPEDQEVLEISRLGEQLKIDSTTPSNSGVPLRHCDSVIQDFHPPHGEDLEDCQQDIGSPCNSGGLHMPNSRSMLNFQQSVHRLRYYSQCAPDSPSNQIDEANFRVSHENILSPSNHVRRAQSCPEIKKDRPSFSGAENLDESVELDYEKTVMNGEENNERGEKSTASSSTQTQWTEAFGGCPSLYPYEHLFLGIFPPVDQQNSFNAGTGRYSPTTFLDRYIELSAGLCSEESQSKRNSNITIQSLESELKTARDQLSLLHLQLKFERQRREVHAERNRRLLGKSRNNRWLEDHNSALRDQLALLGKDVECITRDLDKNKAENRQNESRLQERVKHWQDKYAISEIQNRELKAENERLSSELGQSKQAAATTMKEFQQAEAKLFSVGKELKEATAQASAGEQLKAQVEHLQKELILMGELLQRYREKIGHLTLQSDEKYSVLQEYYVEEVKNLNSLVDVKSCALEASKSRIAELETLLAKKDILIADQKRALKTVKEECQEQLEAVETKYKSQISINRKLEECIFELTSKLETASKRNKRGISAAQDVLSLAERGGLNSPLSLSLSSSEGMSMSGLVPTEIPCRDLQSIVDEPEAANHPAEVNRTETELSPPPSPPPLQPPSSSS